MVTKEAWLALILSGAKTMEIRNRPAQAGPIWIGHGGKIYASAEITECREMTQEEFEKTRAQHRHLSTMSSGSKLYGLLLANIVQRTQPTEYYQKPASELWTFFKTAPDDKIPRRTASKRTATMPALRDQQEAGNSAKETEDGQLPEDDDKDEETHGRPYEHQLHGYDYTCTLEEEVQQFVQAVMHQELQPEQLKWWQDTLKERCRYHRFPCRAWFELVYQWQPPIMSTTPDTNDGAQGPRPRTSQSHPTPTCSIPCYVPILLHWEQNTSPAPRPSIRFHRL
ncbi:unnamed protein product [Symbiodinium sp. CCMP2592]|nr:unnamed protein product [Symbiodinium sp. CCMP2592]